MKRLLSEVKEPSEKQQTNAHHRDGEEKLSTETETGWGRLAEAIKHNCKPL